MAFLKLPSLFTLCSSFIIITACAQVRPIVKGYVYSQLINEGVNQVDENGNSVSSGLNRKIYIYLEGSGSGKPSISQVRYNGKIYNAPPVYFNADIPVAVGTVAASGKKIMLSPARRNHLWRTELTIAENENKPAGIPHSTILVNGIKDGKAFTIVLKNEVILAAAIAM